ncbi:unnamed protein product [Brugia pahangi]|uniref:Reverse transcriptase n=1 Tax=Brugia pahangi TaxID=6280 RepID=A0A0N4TMR4_BRUPA|nr:unnamed protein product [Brugia pahangi]
MKTEIAEFKDRSGDFGGRSARVKQVTELSIIQNVLQISRMRWEVGGCRPSNWMIEAQIGYFPVNRSSAGRKFLFPNVAIDYFTWENHEVAFLCSDYGVIVDDQQTTVRAAVKFL